LASGVWGTGGLKLFGQSWFLDLDTILSTSSQNKEARTQADRTLTALSKEAPVGFFLAPLAGVFRALHVCAGVCAQSYRSPHGAALSGQPTGSGRGESRRSTGSAPFQCLRGGKKKSSGRSRGGGGWAQARLERRL
jgi:hypothetical protein